MIVAPPNGSFSFDGLAVIFEAVHGIPAGLGGPVRFTECLVDFHGGSAAMGIPLHPQDHR